MCREDLRKALTFFSQVTGIGGLGGKNPRAGIYVIHTETSSCHLCGVNPRPVDGPIMAQECLSGLQLHLNPVAGSAALHKRRHVLWAERVSPLRKNAQLMTAPHQFNCAIFRCGWRKSQPDKTKWVPIQCPPVVIVVVVCVCVLDGLEICTDSQISKPKRTNFPRPDAKAVAYRPQDPQTVWTSPWPDKLK